MELKKLTKEFEGIIKELGLKFVSYRRGGRLILKVFIPNEGWREFINPHWFNDCPKEKMASFLRLRLINELQKRLGWKYDPFAYPPLGGLLRGNYISVAIYVTPKKKTIIVDFYPPNSEEPVATLRMEKPDLGQLTQLLRSVDALGML
jgi:hypothetical protein